MGDLTPIMQEHESRVSRGAVQRLPPIQYATNGLTQVNNQCQTFPREPL